MTYDSSPASPQRIEMTARSHLSVTGVEDVDRFDENEIVMNTGEGVLIVTGEGLHIGKLSLDGGELHVDGRIDSLSFEDAPAGRGGFLSRLIKRRTVANEACDGGRVTVNGKVARASYDVKVGDVIALHFGERVLAVEVLDVSETAGKSEASLLYREVNAQ